MVVVVVAVEVEVVITIVIIFKRMANSTHSDVSASTKKLHNLKNYNEINFIKIKKLHFKNV